jgi:hypothetical protein
MRLGRVGVALCGAVALLLPVGLLLAPSSDAVDSTVTSSAVTVHGTGEDSDLTIDVSQTANLIDQVVQISWQGAPPTQPSVGSFDRDYLQIMQCWGDDPAGPTREQCQFGGLVGDGRGGNYVASRQVSYGDSLVDPLETYKQPEGSLDNVNVPFHSVTGQNVSTTLNEFYDGSSTNELPFARTRTNGTGREFFEVETGREAPGLGCGEPVADPTTGKSKPRGCWLVVVPRGEHEVDGKPATGGDRLVSSPLSATNWKRHIAIPLSFQPLGLDCPIGSAERRTVGQESVVEAVNHWQPALCQQSGAVYGFSSVSDDLARSQLLTPTPGLAFISKPLSSDQAPPKGTAVYAPVAVSGLVFAFNIDSRAGSKASAERKLQDGQRLSELVLSARLVAKLITQSYQLAVNPSAPSIAGNPPDLLRDPDFLALNPSYSDLFLPGLASPLEPLGLADAYEQLWAWVSSDKDAKAFLAGRPDPWGMHVNPYYKNLDLPRSDLPKSDPYCADISPDQPPLCTLDAHPYAADLHDAARSASRGDTLSRASYDPTATPPAYKKGPPQLSGSRLVLAVTDAASAARYQLPTAKLLNAGGNLVAPTTTSLLAGVTAMTKVGGVLRSNPASTDPQAYPLTTLTYAATVPAALTSAERKDYATLLRYAAGPGQLQGVDPGQLPPGYAPLPAALRAQTRAAATEILTAPVPTATPSTAGPSSAQQSTVSPAPVHEAPAAVPHRMPLPAAASPAGEPLPPVVATSPPTTAIPPTVAVSRTVTPAVPIGSSRYLVLACLLLGSCAAAGGPLVGLARRDRGGGARA